MTTALEGGEGSASRSGHYLPPGKTRYPLYRRLGEPQGRSGQVRKISPPPGFDPPVVQLAASSNTDYANRPTLRSGVKFNLVKTKIPLIFSRIFYRWIILHTQPDNFLLFSIYSCVDNHTSFGSKLFLFMDNMLTL